MFLKDLLWDPRLLTTNKMLLATLTFADGNKIYRENYISWRQEYTTVWHKSYTRSVHY